MEDFVVPKDDHEKLKAEMAGLSAEERAQMIEKETDPAKKKVLKSISASIKRLQDGKKYIYVCQHNANVTYTLFFTTAKYKREEERIEKSRKYPVDDTLILEDEARRKKHFGTEPSAWPAPSPIVCPDGVDPGEVIFVWQFLKYFAHLFTSVKVVTLAQLMKLFSECPPESVAKKVETLHADLARVKKKSFTCGFCLSDLFTYFSLTST